MRTLILSLATIAALGFAAAPALADPVVIVHHHHHFWDHDHGKTVIIKKNGD